MLKITLTILFLSVSNFAQTPQTPSEIVNAESSKVISQPSQENVKEVGAKKTPETVRLRVTFLASGEIGETKVVKQKKKLTNDDVTQRAIEAARKIKFIPWKKNGVPVTVTKTVEYSLSQD